MTWNCFTSYSWKSNRTGLGFRDLLGVCGCSGLLRLVVGAQDTIMR